MRTQLSLAVLATALACSLASAPAYARARVFVASYGNDSNPCTFGSPCKTFQQAVNVVDAGGEVTAIDSAGFGPISITKPVTITSPDGVEAGIVPNAGTPAITINTPGDVFLRGLTIEGGNSGTDGISLTGGGTDSATTLGIVHCVIRHFAHDGIYLQPTNTLNLSIIDTIASNNANDGIDLSPSGNGTMAGVIDHSTTISNGVDGMNVWGANTNTIIFIEINIVNSVTANNGRNGVNAFTAQPIVSVTVRDTSSSTNFLNGFEVDGQSVMFFAHSEAIGNFGSGIRREAGTTGNTFGDNYVGHNGNGDVVGTLIPNGLR
jgi:hypothetical protein